MIQRGLFQPFLRLDFVEMELKFRCQQLFYLLQHKNNLIMASGIIHSSPNFLSENSSTIESLGNLLQVNPHHLVCMANSSACALWKLTEQLLLATPCYKLLALTIQSGQSAQACEPVNAKVMKELLRESVTNTQASKRCQLPHGRLASGVDEINSNLMSVFSSGILKGILKQYFFREIQEVLLSFRRQYSSKYPSKPIQFAWKQDTCEKIFQESVEKVLSCKNIQEIQGMAKNGHSQVASSCLESLQEDRELLYFKLMLSKLDGSLTVKLQLFKLFSEKCSQTKSGEKEIQRWMNCANDLGSTVRNQMKELQAQAFHNSQLEEEIQHLTFQLSQAEQRIAEVDSQVLTLQREIAQLKQPVVVQEPSEGYYMNPHFQRSQYEEKLFTEMVEIESELLIGKEQIKLMSDCIVELLKACRNSLDDLQASKFFLCSFNKSAQRILKDVRSLECVDLEGLLGAKGDSQSLFDSECFETRKSELSTFSEIEMDQKMSRYTEDDTLSLTNNDRE